MFYVSLFFRGALLFSSEPGDLYFIDVVEESVEFHCQDCPMGVGQMYISRPMQLKDIKDPAQDIIVETCHFSLVNPQVVQTAGHCARQWFEANWQEAAGGDCSKVFSFFATDQDGAMTFARCEEILSPNIYSVYGEHTSPDVLFIQLDRELKGQWPVATNDQPHFDQQDVFEIWGVEDKQLQRRQCRYVPRSVLSPLRSVGHEQSPFVTLTCDGSITYGWSGAGVFKDGILVGHVSQTHGQNGLHSSRFGDNEVVISQQACHQGLYGESDVEITHNECFSTRAYFHTAVQESHFLAFDLAKDWQSSTRERLLQNFPYAKFKYVVEPLASELSAVRRRAMELECVHPSMLKDMDNSNGLLYRVEVELERLHPKFVQINADSQVEGLYGVLAPEPFIGGFYVPYDFQRSLSWESAEGGIELVIPTQGEPIYVPYCAGTLD
jgi:hypothetical protein